MKTKLKISKLKVQSFVTSIEKNQINGGAAITLDECLTGNYQTIDLDACINKTLHTLKDCTQTGPSVPLERCLSTIALTGTNCPPTRDGICYTLKCEN